MNPPRHGSAERAVPLPQMCVPHRNLPGGAGRTRYLIGFPAQGRRSPWSALRMWSRHARRALGVVEPRERQCLPEPKHRPRPHLRIGSRPDAHLRGLRSVLELENGRPVGEPQPLDPGTRPCQAFRQWRRPRRPFAFEHRGFNPERRRRMAAGHMKVLASQQAPCERLAVSLRSSPHRERCRLEHRPPCRPVAWVAPQKRPCPLAAHRARSGVLRRFPLVSQPGAKCPGAAQALGRSNPWPSAAAVGRHG